MTRRPTRDQIRSAIAAQAPLPVAGPDPFYRTAAWRELSAECIRRQPVCATPNCGQPSKIADHITPRRKGGPDCQSNLRALCRPCHNRITKAGNEGPLRAIGAFPDGTPRDASHWWNEENLSGLGRKTDVGAPKRVSSASTSRRGR